MKVKIKTSTVIPVSNFAIVKKENEYFKSTQYDPYDYCRELFTPKIKRTTKYIAFGCMKKNMKKFKEFLDILEGRLGIKRKTKVYETDRNIVVLELSYFWKQNIMRKQFFTAAIRAGLNYNRSFWAAIRNCRYFKTSLVAVKKFFKGFTSLKKGIGFYGWVSTFGGISKYELMKTMVKS